jgi:hypothetical protein
MPFDTLSVIVPTAGAAACRQGLRPARRSLISGEASHAG